MGHSPQGCKESDTTEQLTHNRDSVIQQETGCTILFPYGASILERGVRHKKKRKEQNKITLENDKCYLATNRSWNDREWRLGKLLWTGQTGEASRGR